MHSQLGLLFRYVGGEARTCIALKVRELFSMVLMRYGLASGIYRDLLQQTINPTSNGGTTTLARRIVNHILTDVHSSSSLLQALSISRLYTFPSNLRYVFCETYLLDAATDECCQCICNGQKMRLSLPVVPLTVASLKYQHTSYLAYPGNYRRSC